jgi:diacylglycerol kinase family enzyme
VTVAATADETELVEALADLRDRPLIVIGGDGSVHAAVNALDRVRHLDPRDSVGVISRGTGNDLARALGLPLAGCHGPVVLDGHPRPLDVLRDDDGGLIVNVGVGALATAEAMPFKSRLGTGAFPLGAAVAGVTSSRRPPGGGRRRRPRPRRGRPDGRREHRCPHARGVQSAHDRGRHAPCPGALPDDGLADVVVCTTAGPLAWAAFEAALLAGSHTDRPDAWLGRGRQATFRGSPTEVSADGELQVAVGSRTWSVEHHACPCSSHRDSVEPGLFEATNGRHRGARLGG